MLKQRIEAGEVLLGTMISEFGCPNLIRIMKAGGFDFVIIDGEHGPFDMSQFAAMIAIGNSIEMKVLIRVPGIDRGLITKLLDMGADGFLVPMVSSAKEAEQLVTYAKYEPIGKRGISLTRAHTNYHPPKLTEYMKEANSRTILFVQIETEEGVENAEKIAAVPGIDALIVGPSDLSSDLGTPGVLSSERLLKSAERVTEASISHGKRCGTISANFDYIRKCQDMGMTLFNMESELSMLVKGAGRVTDDFWKGNKK